MAAWPLVLGYVVLLTHGNSGEELHWNTFEVDYSVSGRGSPDVGNEFEAIDRAFGSWNAVSGINYRAAGCTSRGVSSIYSAGSGEKNDGSNVIAWMESGWPYGPGTIGITFTWFNPDTGVVGEADMLLNGEDYRWSDGPPHLTDVESIIAHEAGHYLGLDHTPQTEATMYATVQPGETKKRDLHADDIAGARYLYGSTASGSPGTTGLCSTDGRGCNCNLSSSASGPGGPLAGALGILALSFGWVLARRGVPVPARIRGRGLAATFAVALLAGLGLSSPASATVMIDLPVRDLAAHSDLVVVGTVEEVESFTDGVTIQTRQKIVVADVLAGEVSTGEVELWTPGGELPEGVEGPNGYRGLTATGIPKFEVGEEVVLFAWRRPFDPPGVVRVTGLQQGKMVVSRDAVTGEARLFRDLTGILRMVETPEGLRPVFVDDLHGIRLEELRDQLKALPGRGAK